MISHESNKVLSQQLEASQSLAHQQQQRLREVEHTVRELTQHSEQLKADAWRLQGLAAASENEKDRAVAELTAEIIRLREELLQQPGDTAIYIYIYAHTKRSDAHVRMHRYTLIFQIYMSTT